MTVTVTSYAQCTPYIRIHAYIRVYTAYMICEYTHWNNPTHEQKVAVLHLDIAVNNHGALGTASDVLGYAHAYEHTLAAQLS
jgi:hypothetical protein